MLDHASSPDAVPVRPIGRALRLFHVGARPGGTVFAQMLNWTGQVLKAPRAELAAALKRKEASYSGVYVLLGEGAAYIGEADDISSRIKAHHASKDWWTTVVMITAGEDKLDKALIKYLEGRLIEEALKFGRVRLRNQVQSDAHGLGEADRADMEGFIGDLLFVLASLGIDAFTRASRGETRGHQFSKCHRDQEPESRSPIEPDLPRIARAEERLATLGRLSGIGMTLAEALPAAAPASPSDHKVLAEAFACVSRAIRLTIVLEGKLDEDIAGLKSGTLVPARPRPARRADEASEGRDRIRDAVSDAIDNAGLEDEQAAAIRAEYERLVVSEGYEAFLDLPLEEAVRQICEALGVTFDRALWAEDPDPPTPAAPPADRQRRLWPPSPEPVVSRRQQWDSIGETSQFRPPGVLRPP